MVDRILVAIDGSKATQALLELGCTLADKYEAKLGILYVTVPQEFTKDLLRAAEMEGVINTPSYTSALSKWDYYGTIDMREQMHRGEAAMQLSSEVGQTIVTQAKAFTATKAVKAVKTFVRTGDITDAILSVAGEADADLIIMGHERRSKLEGLIHKSVAASVDGKAQCPCLVLSQ
jgi:nucleotide-binding universal stress UspA family protein